MSLQFAKKLFPIGLLKILGVQVGENKDIIEFIEVTELVALMKWQPLLLLDNIILLLLNIES